jgi:GH25 family lysozyme M1 (1,4-beta-N-acetylmuramidase)
MKGLQELQWLFLILALSLIIIAWGISPMATAITEAIRTNARLTVLEMAGLINLLEASPDDTCYKYSMYKMDCTVVLNETMINITVRDGENLISYNFSLLQTGTRIEPVVVECNKEKEKPVYFIRQGNTISIYESKIDMCEEFKKPPAPTTIPVTGTEDGIDVSHHNGDIDWAKVYDAGYTFAFVKASEGTNFKDDKFVENMENAKKAGVLVGAYHFARPVLNSDAIEEAEWFVDVAGDYIGQEYLPPALDVEDIVIPEKGIDEHPCADLGKEKLSEWIRDWMETVKSKTGVEPVLYVNSNYANNCLEDYITDYSLWIAHWYVPSPNTGVWDSWNFWQYVDKGSVPGISGKVDLDTFNGYTG